MLPILVLQRTPTRASCCTIAGRHHGEARHHATSSTLVVYRAEYTVCDIETLCSPSDSLLASVSLIQPCPAPKPAYHTPTPSTFTICCCCHDSERPSAASPQSKSKVPYGGECIVGQTANHPRVWREGKAVFRTPRCTTPCRALLQSSPS